MARVPLLAQPAQRGDLAGALPSVPGGEPALAEVDAKTVEHMRPANALPRFLEIGEGAGMTSCCPSSIQTYVPDDLQAAAAVLLFLLPGALAVWWFERHAGAWGIRLPDRLFRLIGVSVAFHAVAAPLT
jgi:hypothetical protein